MARHNLLKDAIADANEMRDVAIVQAKISLEEAFKPHLASIISTRLRNEAAVNEDNDASSEIGSGAVTVKNPGPKNPSKATSDSSHIKNSGLEVEDVLDGPTGMPKKVSESVPGMEGEGDDEFDFDFDAELGADDGFGEDPAAGGEFGGNPAAAAPTGAPDAFGGAPDAFGGEPDAFGGEPDAFGGAPDAFGGEPDAFGDEQISDLDLEAIIRELELDVNDMSNDEPAFESFDDPMAGKKVNGAFDGSNIRETVSGTGDEGVFKDGKSPASAEGVPGGKKVTPGQEVTGTKAETMMEDTELDEILREIEQEELAHAAGSKNIANENVILKKSIREHRDVVQYLRGKLQEVNMLNAKLLFCNRLFRAFDMNVEQKMHTVKTFDRATTLREVKLVYATLAESAKGRRVVQKKVPARVVEGLASKAVGSTRPKTPQVLAEGNDLRARFMKLAQISKDN